MTLLQLKKVVDQASKQDRRVLAAYLSHLSHRDDPDYCREMEASVGRAYLHGAEYRSPQQGKEPQPGHEPVENKEPPGKHEISKGNSRRAGELPSPFPL